MSTRSLALFSFLSLVWACDGTSASTDAVTPDTIDVAADAATRDSDVTPIDPATLDPHTIAFAARSGGGAWTEQEAFFFNFRHGWRGTWVYGDRRAVVIDYSGTPTLGYRVYREGTIPEAAFLGLLQLAQGLTASGQVSYSCFPLDELGYEDLAVALPSRNLVARSHVDFANCESAYLPTEATPPEEVSALASALLSLDVSNGTVLEPARILLAGYDAARVPAAEDACATADFVEWPFEDVALPANPDEIWTLPLEGETAIDVRTFVREHARPTLSIYSGSACVKQGNTLHIVFYDDVPDGEEAWPF